MIPILAMLPILFAILILMFILSKRNHMVYDFRTTRLMEISKVGSKIITDYYYHGIGDGNWRKVYDDFEKGPSYGRMLFSLTKWKYEDFYPDKAEIYLPTPNNTIH